MKQIAFLGLGIMGSAMAANLVRGEVDVRGWNRTAGKPSTAVAAAAGVDIRQTAREAVTEAEAVFLCLGDENDIEAVLLGAQGLAVHLSPGALVVDTSTSGPRCAARLDKALSALGLRFLDAPVSGGDIGARQGTLTFMVGGSEKDFADALPLFQCMGKTIKHCGPAGSGQVVKLCNQILCAVNMVGVCEALHLAENLGIDPQLVVEVCSTGAAGSWALANLGPRIARFDYEPGFMVKHMLKDLRLVAEAVPAVKEEFPGTNLAKENFQSAKELDGSQGDQQGTQSMMRAYRKT